MKKKIFGAIAVLAIAVMAAWNVNLSKQSNFLAGVSLKNVEALADGEVNEMCPNGCYSDGDGCYCHQYYENYKEAGNN